MDRLPKWADVALVPLVSLALAALISALVILAIGQDPMEALNTMVTGALGSAYGWGYTLYYTTSFIFTGLAVTIAFHAGLFNIGGEGQAQLGGLGVAFACLFLPWPHWTLALMAAFAVLLAFASATQDINVDAFRIESAPEQLQAALAAAYLTGYRLAMILASAGTLWLAALFSAGDSYDLAGWQLAYLAMALCMLPGIVTTLASNEPVSQLQQHTSAGGTVWQRCVGWLQQAVVAPFIDFFSRYKWQALLILALIACYRLTDIVMGVMANAFYVDMGFSKEEVASISKVYGVMMTLLESQRCRFCHESL